MEFQKPINGLRAIAVVAVLLYHFRVPGIDSGFVGVDVFFVISGYLMTHILMYGGEELQLKDIRRFYSHRVRRIVPPLLVVTLVVMVGFGTFLLHSDYVNLLRSVVSADLFSRIFTFKV